MVDINTYKSHPNKKLQDHIDGVIGKTKNLTNFKSGELAAIFHDIGKINPNFQDKILGKKNSGYSNHAYLSAYFFWCYYCDKYQVINERFGVQTLRKVLQILTIIAKHHGNLPNFIPVNYNYECVDSILDEEEINRLFNFINQTDIRTKNIIEKFLPAENVNELIRRNEVQSQFKELFISFDKKDNKNPLNFFFETQFSFASLILADKKDAANNVSNDYKEVKRFCKNYNYHLNKYLSSLNSKQHIPINKLRTEIREKSVKNISNSIKNDNNRVFTLTAPTGSGKTLILLSLADEIIKQKGDFRIIYSLPFLSITEQVEAEVLNIFKEDDSFIQRIDSKSENDSFQKLQEEIEKNPSTEKIRKLLTIQFQEDTFAYPFIITTFVRFFETLLSNKNATLLKLPNFAKTIFLIDEIQALPPRLYSFFIAFLSEFCKKFDSYAIISTATMPYTNLPHEASNYKIIKEVFNNYNKPFEVSDYKYFSNPLFNRYNIKKKDNTLTVEELAVDLLKRKNSVLVILNTIDDTKDLYNKLKDSLDKENLILLNTHFTPNDRKNKIKEAKNKLVKKDWFIVVSTQLVEAGVDIDFPIVYRDISPIPNIIQSAGRCNRNGKLNFGEVILFTLQKEGKKRAELIYRGKDKQFLNFTYSTLNSSFLEEPELFYKQKKYFEDIGTKLEFAKHTQNGKELDFINEIKEAGFSNIGSFKLIDPDFFGEEFKCYVRKNENDSNFEILKQLVSEQKEAFTRSIEEGMSQKLKIKDQLKKMSGEIIQVRIRQNKEERPLFEDEILGIHLLADSFYSNREGIKLTHTFAII